MIFQCHIFVIEYYLNIPNANVLRMITLCSLCIELTVSCNNLFLNPFDINMLKLELTILSLESYLRYSLTLNIQIEIALS